MATEHIEKLAAFSKSIQGEFTETREPSTTTRGGGWSRVEIRLPFPHRKAVFVAYSGTNQAEVYSGFYAESKLPGKLVCTITQRDKVLSLIHSFNKLKIKSGRTSFDRKLHILSNDKQFVHKLAGNPDIAEFLESNLVMPLRFEVVSNYNGYLKTADPELKLLSISTNEWIVEQKKLMNLYTGFRLIVEQVR